MSGDVAAPPSRLGPSYAERHSDRLLEPPPIGLRAEEVAVRTLVGLQQLRAPDSFRGGASAVYGERFQRETSLMAGESSWKLPIKMSSMFIEVYVFSENQEISAESRLNSEKVSLIDESEFR